MAIAERDEEITENLMEIRVKGLREMRFQMRSKRTLRLPLTEYSRRMGAPLATFRFVYDGVRVRVEDTPESLGMISGDIIDVYKDQLGGYL